MGHLCRGRKWEAPFPGKSALLYLHSRVCPLCKEFSTFVERELKEILTQNPGIKKQQISRQQYVRDLIETVAMKQDHPHVEAYRKDVYNEEVNSLIIRSPEEAQCTCWARPWER